ncbi:Fic family protein [Patescibacteria group bacterium]|nr:Fic family protein [Patescibacteria group bacterium]MBU1663417.1 Fic family protein [Patescibacteria group bacterium]MBU1933989.1 Fic family protein [Patescibacteria group bacterium]MBU2008158.1 Fic family protein [Patescibacteria group bacterium]MBU2233503.1 Fic family protein [Patescibacteria group bacterium]
MFNPKYTLNNKILSELTAIAEAKGIIDRTKILPQQELRLRRQAVIRMTHHSTEIEGNRLNIGQVEALYAKKKIDAPDRDVYEVKNYLNALKYIEKVVAGKKPITEKVILKIHKLVTAKTLALQFSGHYRPGQIYVVRRQFGVPQETLYTGPEAKQVPKLMADFTAWLKDSEAKEINPVIVAGIAHLELAAIHPFNDGNGRTARALATLMLYQRGYDFRRLFALEDYYNTNRQAYYKAINVGKTYDERRTDITSWLEYFVKGFKREIDEVKNKILPLAARNVGGKIKSQIYLTPEQLKIIDFIDQVGRISTKDVENILSSPKRTAQLQLQKLKKNKMIKAIGKGKSTSYIVNSQ